MPLTDAQKRVEKLLPPNIRKIRRQGRARAAATEKAGKNKRVRPRVTIAELNKGGVAALKAKGITPQKVQSPDPRSGFEVVLDWVDLPRNLVAQAVGSLAGVDKSKIKEKGTFGLKRVRMSDVLDKMGVAKGVGRSVAGFIGDVAIDPLTYLSAGATTGKSIAKHLPRVKKSFFKELGSIAKGTGDALDPNIVKGLGGAKRVSRLQRLAREGGKTSTALQAQKRLLGKKGGFLTRSLERASSKATPQGVAARAALQKGSLEGRKLLRVPFTQIAGPTVPGKQARAFKALGDVEGFQKLAEATKIPREVTAITSKVKNLQLQASKAASAGDEITAQALRDEAKALLGQGRDIARVGKDGRLPGQFLQRGERAGTEALQGLAKGEIRLQRFGGNAPELLKLRNEAIQGKSATSKLGQSVAQIFGPGTSPRNAQELAIRHGATQGKTSGFVRQFQKIQPKADKTAKVLLDEGIVKGEATDARRVMFNALEKEDALRQKWNLHPNDPLRQMQGLDELSTLPEVQAFNAEHNLTRRQWAEELTKRGVQTEQASIARKASNQSRPALAAQAQRIGEGKGASATFAGKTLQPPNQTRTKMVELIDPKTGQAEQFLTRSSADINAKAADGFLIRANVVDSAGTVVQPNVPLSAQKIAELEKQGMKVVITRYDPSAEMINKMLVEKKGLRTILGFDEAQKIDTFFDFDPAGALASQAAQHEQQLAALNLRDVAKQSGVMVDAGSLGRPEFSNMKIPKALPEGHPLRSLIGEGVYDFAGQPSALAGGRSQAYPAPVADMLDRMNDVFQGGEQTNSLLKATDATLGWFKRFALFHPAYVTRNVWDNNFGIIMTGGNPAKAARMGIFNPQARKIRTAVLNNDIGSLTGKIRIAGKNIPEREIAQFVLDHNMMQAGSTAAQTAQAFARDAGRAGTVAGLAGKKGRAFFDAVRTGNSFVEENMRMGAFLSFLDEGMSSRQALMNTTLAMPDLSNVTRFEQQALTRIFPWYRWAKNNGARQLFHFIPKKPAFLAGVGKLQHLIQGMAPTVPDNLRPEWMREAQAAQISGDEESGSAFLLRNWFPFEEAQSLAAGLASPAETARYIAGSTRPGVKFVAELATGSDIFRQRKTEPFTLAETVSNVPSAFVGGSGTPLDNLLAIRPLREFRRVGDQPDVLGKALRVGIGGAVQPLSAERGRIEIDLKTRNALQKLRQQINRAQENNDSVEVQSLMHRFVQLQTQRQRTGLKIPKSTQEALANAAR